MTVIDKKTNQIHVKVLQIILWLTLFLSAKLALAITPFTIENIQVQGNQRLEEGTIYNYLPLKVGDVANDEELRLSIKELFETGFFQDVRFEQSGNTLIVNVLERPSIASIGFSGNDRVDDSVIEDALTQTGLIQGRILNPQNLARLETDLEQSYLSLGRYGATVETAITELEDNRVDVQLNIEEGGEARIKEINIIGAQQVSERKIRSEMQLKSRRGFGFSRKDQYSKQKLEADLEAIRSYYLDRGYHDFEIVNSNVELSPNKQEVFINISISEGEVYTFASPVIEGVGEQQLESLASEVTVTAGDTFSRKTVQESGARILGQYADDGYAFADVRITTETDSSANTVTPIFTIVPNQRVYVRRVNISGNYVTRDEVIRRELRQFEGGWFSAEALQRSVLRLKRLGFFQDVTIETPPVPGTVDQIDMNVNVVERDTGSIQLSAGYSDADGVLIGAAYEQRNLLGTGKNINLKINNSDASRIISVEHTNPYVTKDGISRTYNLTSRKTDSTEVDTAEYIIDQDSFGITHRIPIAETNSFSVGVLAMNLDLEATDQTPDEFLKIINAQPDATDFITTFGVSKDARNDFFFPTAGGTAGISVENSLPGSDFEYYKVNVQGSVFFPLADFLTLKLGASYGYGDGYGDSNQLPFFRNYFGGGSDSVRGYRSRSLGPRDSGDTPQPIGGSERVLGSVEFLLPPFGAKAKDKRLGFFFDAGQVYRDDVSSKDPNLTKNDLDDKVRYSAGMMFNWLSPLGPFSLTYGVPLNDDPFDELDRFQISFGTTFE